MSLTIEIPKGNEETVIIFFANINQFQEMQIKYIRMK